MVMVAFHTQLPLLASQSFPGSVRSEEQLSWGIWWSSPSRRQLSAPVLFLVPALHLLVMVTMFSLGLISLFPC